MRIEDQLSYDVIGASKAENQQRHEDWKKLQQAKSVANTVIHAFDKGDHYETPKSVDEAGAGFLATFIEERAPLNGEKTSSITDRIKQAWNTAK